MKMKDEQIIELRKQIQMFGTQKDRTLQELQLAQLREQALQEKILELQGNLFKQAEDREALYQKFIIE